MGMSNLERRLGVWKVSQWHNIMKWWRQEDEVNADLLSTKLCNSGTEVRPVKLKNTRSRLREETEKCTLKQCSWTPCHRRQQRTKISASSKRRVWKKLVGHRSISRCKGEDVRIHSPRFQYSSEASFLIYVTAKAPGHSTGTIFVCFFITYWQQNGISAVKCRNLCLYIGLPAWRNADRNQMCLAAGWNPEVKFCCHSNISSSFACEKISSSLSITICTLPRLTLKFFPCIIFHKMENLLVFGISFLKIIIQQLYCLHCFCKS